MSSIRLFVLDAVARRGEMHGHPLRLLAEGEQPDALPSAAPPIPGGLAARRPATPAAPPIPGGLAARRPATPAAPPGGPLV